MLAFDDICIDLTRDGWEVEISSATEWVKETKSYKLLGHEIRLNRVNQLSNSHDDHVDEIVALASSYTDLLPLMRKIEAFVKNHPEDEGQILDLKLSPFKSLSQIASRDAELKENMDELQVLEEMMHAGWAYQLNFNPIRRDNPQYKRLSFSRWDWHGEFTTFSVDIWTLAAVNALWDKVALKLAKNATKAYKDFPNSIPHINASGEIVEDKMKTELFRESISKRARKAEKKAAGL